MNTNNLMNDQYKSSEYFDARVLIHSKYGVNKTPWPIWLFNNYQFPENASIIEFGCGNGLIWKVNSARINPSWKVLLTDISEGMLESTKAAVGTSDSNILFSKMDISNPHPDFKNYNIVIANHMLYHVDKREDAINSVKKILSGDGIFYASTVGQKNMHEMKTLVSEYCGNSNYADAMEHIADNFSKENGMEQLKKSFNSVEWIEYEDSLVITDAVDLVKYIYSCNNLKPGFIVMAENQKNDFTDFITKRIEKDGSINISKSSGTFIARNI